MMSPFDPVTRGGGASLGSGDMPVTRGGGGSKISLFCGDIIIEWPPRGRGGAINSLQII